ncbi:hypothetical protein I4641_15525 [Waterburya agarophytonicola K14]|uniref:Uncharacterized protein n=1 Tax=Waterburya agarophytonicola KI4 TaxID=2874699 RepID=A0A964BSK6_9CYAN|nr:hypothetical protein [Waterburya agarophytonicola]MCC0178389.1 hypothetical protein [Waterburya agarophytonicola KI4]
MPNVTKSDHPSKYHCCFCHHFNLEGHRWGYCELLNVYVKGNIDACQLSVPPFVSIKELPDNQIAKSK